MNIWGLTPTREAGELTRTSLLPRLLQIQRHSPIPSLDGRPPCWRLFTLLPFSRESRGFSPSNSLPSNSWLYPSPQLHQAFPGNLQATWSREAGTLTADLHLSLHSNKSNPQSHPSPCSRIPVAVSPFSKTPFPVSNRLHRSSHYPSHQHQQAFLGTQVTSKVREIGWL